MAAKRGKPRHPEYAIQCAIARHLAAVLHPDVFFTAIPAGNIGGGAEAARRGAMIKAMGYRAGTPDLMLLHEGRAFFIEIKAADGELSPAQDLTHLLIRRAGAPVFVARSVIEVETILRAAEIPMRGRIAA